MKYSEPWEYFIQDNFLPKDIIEELKILKIDSDNTQCDGTRTPVSGRYFFTPDKLDMTTLRVVDFFRTNTPAFESEFGYDLSDSYMRIELAQDDSNFWQVPHIDTLEKRITIIVYIDGEGDLGTDLYSSPDEDYHTRLEWKHNRCFVFKTDETKWHGFTKRPFEGKRKVLLINYVDKDNWRSKDQVWDL
jgi:hypothetical protein